MPAPLQRYQSWKGKTNIFEEKGKMGTTSFYQGVRSETNYVQSTEKERGGGKQLKISLSIWGSHNFTCPKTTNTRKIEILEQPFNRKNENKILPSF